MSYFHPLEVVGRCSETQLQVGENLSYLFERFKCKNDCMVYLYLPCVTHAPWSGILH